MASAPILLSSPNQSVGAASCASSVGPGIPAPTSVASGLPGFHASWYGQSGYPTLCPGQTSTATVAYYNSGSLGWVADQMGQAAYLGTWGPSPGQDAASLIGGDGTLGSPNTGWPRYNRIAIQPAPYVGPGQVAWFQFTIKAPSTPGFYQLYLRPLIEGATWLEDYGVFWQVTVLNPDGSIPPPPPLPGCDPWPVSLGLILAKLPNVPTLCLLHVAVAPPGFASCLTSCYSTAVIGSGRIYEVRLQPGESETAMLAHEICHGHQQLVTINSGVSWSVYDWIKTDEAASFKAALEAIRTSNPAAYAYWFFADANSPTPPLETFANVCSAWYYPNEWAFQLTETPSLVQFAKTWLPK